MFLFVQGALLFETMGRLFWSLFCFPLTHQLFYLAPHTLRHMMDMFNRSPTSTTLICYQQPKKCYELGLATTTTMIQRFPMKMCGSGEQHSCFVYAKEEHHMLSSAPLKVVLPTTPVHRGAPDRLKGNHVMKAIRCVVGVNKENKKVLIRFISLLLLLLLY